MNFFFLHIYMFLILLFIRQDLIFFLAYFLYFYVFSILVISILHLFDKLFHNLFFNDSKCLNSKIAFFRLSLVLSGQYNSIE